MLNFNGVGKLEILNLYKADTQRENENKDAMLGIIFISYKHYNNA